MFKNKLNVGGKVETYKYILLAKGYSQMEGLDFGDIFSLVDKLNFIRFLWYINVSF